MLKPRRSSPERFPRAPQGFVPTVTSIGPFGSVSSATTGSWQTALAQTVQAAGQVYADQVLKSIKDDGVYIRVPAGKQFYLYVTQTVDLSKSTRGGSKVTSTQEADSNEKPNLLFVSLMAFLPACSVFQHKHNKPSNASTLSASGRHKPPPPICRNPNTRALEMRRSLSSTMRAITSTQTIPA